MLEILLWSALAVLAYIYVGYPLLAILLARLRPRPVHRGPVRASVTAIITAYNEEKHIGQKLQNVLAADYPAQLLDVIVASDASSDATDRIVRECDAPNVRLLRVEGRLGKTACQNAAAKVARGDILVFMDATTMTDPGALRAMVGNFHDPGVGCVAGRLVYRARGADATSRGGTSYWGYETRLRMAESALGSLIGVSGQLYAVRRNAYRPIAPDLISDFVIAMAMRGQGLRTVLEPDAVCYEDTLDRSDQELPMRVRVGLRSLYALASQRRFLDPFRYGAFAWELWSHKLLRYLSPVFWTIALLANIALALQGRYLPLLALQVLVLALGTLGFLPLRRFGGWRLLAQPYYFLLTNLASAVSLFKFLRGERIVTWTPLR
ncbi:glycosyltransferase family 2 protein [Cognatiluteimonas weifangensis]|uniref:glycosyltransferase family 2 protein n=1 Tax=Cognatiluteimonas weifangensis TaxID=2303539 RepID=UPI0013143405|nr:glycosyltransferase family 2 protein [Luteimonas weifangensis]